MFLDFVHVARAAYLVAKVLFVGTESRFWHNLVLESLHYL